MHKKVWRLVLPIILANITVPLLGMVDIAVVGHLPGPQYIGAVGIGATLFSALYFGFVFLRMGTTGLVAVSHGAQDEPACTAWLGRALLVAFCIGSLLILAQNFIAVTAFHLIKPSTITLPLAESYFYARIWSAPAALANFALLGWMLGKQKVKAALLVQLILNVTNILFDLYFVIVLKLGVAGAAYATVLAEYTGLIAGVWIARSPIKSLWIKTTFLSLFNIEKLKKLFFVNINIFIRSLCLQVIFFYFTIVGATLGTTILAANAVLMNFQMFTAYALDGFANAAETLAGEAAGKNNLPYFYQVVKTTAIWAVIFSVLFSAGYLILGHPITRVLTDIESIRAACAEFIYWAILFPMISVWCFLLDGIFIGTTHTAPMRNSMLISLGIFLLVSYLLVPIYENHGLWFAFSLFMIVRAMTLGCYWPSLIRKIII